MDVLDEAREWLEDRLNNSPEPDNPEGYTIIKNKNVRIQLKNLEQAEAERETLVESMKQINWRAKTESLDGHLRNVVISISDEALASLKRGLRDELDHLEEEE